jgi:hypothetical protein
MKQNNFARRDFMRLAAAAGITTAGLSGSADASSSEHTANVTPQPLPAPGEDMNTSDILVETLIAWGAPFMFGGSEMASIPSWRRYVCGRIVSATSACATRRPRRSWLPGSPSTPGTSGCASVASAQLRSAVDVLDQGRKVAILVGEGALGARLEVEAVADLLAAPVAKAMLGKAVLADDSPFTTGGVGHLGTEPSHWAMHTCDTMLILGSTMPWIDSYPKPGQARPRECFLVCQSLGEG